LPTGVNGTFDASWSIDEGRLSSRPQLKQQQNDWNKIGDLDLKQTEENLTVRTYQEERFQFICDTFYF